MIQDFALELSILLLGTVEDKLRWIFKLYDLNKVNWNTIYPYPKLIRIMNPIYLLNFNCEAQVQSQIQVLNPIPKSKSKIQNLKSRGKGMGLGLTL